VYHSVYENLVKTVSVVLLRMLLLCSHKQCSISSKMWYSASTQQWEM